MGSELLAIVAVIAILLCVRDSESVKKTHTQSYVEELSDHKDWKKLIRTKNNVLMGYFGEEAGDLRRVLDSVSEAVKGSGSIGVVDCVSQRKLCKKLKVSPQSWVFKHYKNGDFHLEYDRAWKLESFVNFLRDPTGDLPWNEDPSSKDVVHLGDPTSFKKFIKKEKDKKILIMFYAPWCGFCKRLKPAYQEAATRISNEISDAAMAAMDVNQPQNSPISRKYNITAFPTLLFFEGGEMRYPYPLETNLESFVKFLKNPSPEEEIIEKKVPLLHWKDENDSKVEHLDEKSFDEFMGRENSVNVMFYAPWCGHCKKMKPHFKSASNILHEEGVEGKLAAVDCTSDADLCKRFNVGGYPTLKYFKEGKLAHDSGHARETKPIIEFMKNPKEPPPPEKLWSEEESEVHHLAGENFKSFLKKKKHVLVIFYAPWCGHCKKAKPEFVSAAEFFKDSSKVEFAAVDCTTERKICSSNGVSGYPTFRYFSYYDKNGTPRQYDGGRTKKDFIEFMKDPEKAHTTHKSDEEWAEFTKVNHLTESNFDNELRKQKRALIMFYAPWCGHCKMMKKDYAHAATSTPNSKFLFAAVDATKEKKLAERFHVQGYPTLKYFENGLFKEDYSGERKTSDLKNFAERKLSQSKDEL